VPFHHLVNPIEPGKYSFDLKSVSVVAASAEEADVTAKILFLMGRADGWKYAREKNRAALFLDSRGNARYSPAMREYLKFKN
jgi:thiamine biosynthesis lipoprotein ApbE